MMVSRALFARLAALMLVLQAGWSGAAAMAVSAGLEEARILCGTLAPTPEAQAHAAELAALFGLEDDAPAPADSSQGECAACFLAAAAALAGSAEPAERAPSLTARRTTPRVDRASPRTPAGPPVGLRAPPVLI